MPAMGRHAGQRRKSMQDVFPGQDAEFKGRGDKRAKEL